MACGHYQNRRCINSKGNNKSVIISNLSMNNIYGWLRAVEMSSQTCCMSDKSSCMNHLFGKELLNISSGNILKVALIESKGH